MGNVPAFDAGAQILVELRNIVLSTKMRVSARRLYLGYFPMHTTYICKTHMIRDLLFSQ